MAKLSELEGITPEEADLLEATGWSDLHALASADPETVAQEILAANKMLEIAVRAPDRYRIERWVAAAARAVGAPEPAPGRARTREQSAEARSRAAARLLEKEGALATVGGSGAHESASAFSAKLASAPFALPIPARQLAASGISPSEIAVAPLLTPGSIDAPERVNLEPGPAKSLPAAPSESVRAVSFVQKAEAGGEPGRLGVDTEKVRSVEDAQSDPKPVRRSSPPQTPEEARLSLLRTAREETNRGRNPNSRLFVRGVLHDRPKRVWFGGLFVLLLQLVVPLAILSAPLLILSSNVPEMFFWVPRWIIAFPIALPVLGLLCLMVSTGAKCRVCAQKLYVPKNCLKNRKAHHLPLLGHIGAVALHVIFFKWFRCTYCGTSIRIKE